MSTLADFPHAIRAGHGEDFQIYVLEWPWHLSYIILDFSINKHNSDFKETCCEDMKFLLLLIAKQRSCGYAVVMLQKKTLKWNNSTSC